MRVALERAVEHEARHRGHLLQRMRERVAEGEAVEPVASDGRPVQPEALVHREDETGLLECVVERVVRAVAEVAAVEMVGARHHRDQPELGRATRLGRGPRRIGERRDADRGQPGLVGRAVPGDPVVVPPARVGRLGRVELGLVGDEEPDRRIQHDRVDALGVHRAQVRGRVEAVLPLIGEVGAAARDERSGRRQVHRVAVGALRGTEDAARFDDVRVGVEHARRTQRGHVSCGARPWHRRVGSPCR